MIRLTTVLLLLVGLLPGAAQADFVRSNLRFTLYHELGHAVIDLAGVDRFGMEENAADSFALVLADRLHDENAFRAIITDMTALSRLAAEEELFDPWDEYMPEAQRLARAICLYYGLNPAVRRDTARALGMEPRSEEICAEHGVAIRAAWGPILDDLAPEPGAAPVRTLRPARFGKALRLLAKDIERINTMLVLPERVDVETEDCGEDNAYYFRDDRRIVFCIEMLGALRRDARR
ncbi:MAG: DUF4344 domain-containing metallopeptidase [Jannaschia sp.]